MQIDGVSFALGFSIAAGLAQAWNYGREGAIRECRRIVRNGANLDGVFFEDCERDPTVPTSELREMANEKYAAPKPLPSPRGFWGAVERFRA